MHYMNQVNKYILYIIHRIPLPVTGINLTKESYSVSHYAAHQCLQCLGPTVGQHFSPSSIWHEHVCFWSCTRYLQNIWHKGRLVY